MTPNGPPINDWRQMRQQERMRRKQQMMDWRSCRRQGRGNPMIPGVVLLIIGCVFLLSNLGIFFVPFFWMDYWPVFVIAIGLMQAIFRNGLVNRLWGGWMATIGCLFLAHNFGYIRGPVWALIWPSVLIFLGLMFLLRGHERKTLGGNPLYPPGVPSSPIGSTMNVLNENAVFGGIHRRVDSQDFEGGEVTAIFGGVHLDMRGAATKKDEIVIQMNAIFGGVELLVPDTWDVTVRGEGIFGGYEDRTMPKRDPQAGKRPHLIITGSAVFGGVTVT